MSDKGTMSDGVYVPDSAPVSDPAAIKKILKRDIFLLKWFNYSALSHMVSKQANLPPVTTFILITKGRKSGNWIETPIYYSRDGENYAVIASAGGGPKDPVWLGNLKADPNCKIYVKWRTYEMRARIAEGTERERIWKNAAVAYPTYHDYERTAAPRIIPVVVLEKR